MIVIAASPRAKIEATKEALKGTDIDKVRKASEALLEASHKLAEAVYQRVQSDQAAGAGAPSGNGEATSDDEVVEEADYEVIDEEAKKP